MGCHHILSLCILLPVCAFASPPMWADAQRCWSRAPAEFIGIRAGLENNNFFVCQALCQLFFRILGWTLDTLPEGKTKGLPTAVRFSFFFANWGYFRTNRKLVWATTKKNNQNGVVGNPWVLPSIKYDIKNPGNKNIKWIENRTSLVVFEVCIRDCTHIIPFGGRRIRRWRGYWTIRGVSGKMHTDSERNM